MASPSAYQDFKTIVDQINAFRTGSLGMTAMSLTANPAAAKNAKMTAQQINELQDQSANLSNYITRSATGCPTHYGNHHNNVRAHNTTYRDAHKDTLNSSNYRDKGTYYNGYNDGVMYQRTHYTTHNGSLTGTRYNGHYETHRSGQYANRRTHYANRASERNGHDVYCWDNTYNSSDLTSERGTHYYHYTGNYTHRTTHDSYYSSKYGGNRSHNTYVCSGLGGGGAVIA